MQWFSDKGQTMNERNMNELLLFTFHECNIENKIIFLPCWLNFNWHVFAEDIGNGSEGWRDIFSAQVWLPTFVISSRRLLVTHEGAQVGHLVRDAAATLQHLARQVPRHLQHDLCLASATKIHVSFLAVILAVDRAMWGLKIVLFKKKCLLSIVLYLVYFWLWYQKDQIR